MGKVLRLRVRVKPSSKREGVRSLDEGSLEVRVGAPPEKGRANERLIELVSEYYGVRKSDVRILKGASSRNKLLEVLLR